MSPTVSFGAKTSSGAVGRMDLLRLARHGSCHTRECRWCSIGGALAGTLRPHASPPVLALGQAGNLEEGEVIYKHGRLEKKLREHGRTARAEILSIRTEGRGNSAKAQWSADDDLTTSWTFCKLDLRVMPKDEPAFETTVRTRLNTFKSKGDVVPVLYDPADHDKVVVDYQTDAQVAMGKPAPGSGAPSPAGLAGGSEEDELRALLEAEVRAAEGGARSTLAAASTGGSHARLDQLQQLADLHDRGVLSDDELAIEKAKILNES
jgi:hypothetical protein